jgi:hypothetical protein
MLSRQLERPGSQAAALNSHFGSARRICGLGLWALAQKDLLPLLEDA